MFTLTNILIGIAFVFVVTLFAMSYVKAPPDTVAQITDAAKTSLEIDLKSVLAGAIGTKLISSATKSNEQDK